jgi:hypothetical protein
VEGSLKGQSTVFGLNSILLRILLSLLVDRGEQRMGALISGCGGGVELKGKEEKGK